MSTDLNLDAVAKRAKKLVFPFVTYSYRPRIYKRYKTGEPYLDINVKTCRAGYDAEGTMPPSNEAVEGAKKLAEEFGLEYKGFDECEKGYGSFIFNFPS